MKLLTTLFLLFNLMYAQNLEEILKTALENSPVLRSLEKRSASDLQRIDSENNWKNPTIGVAVNDIWLDKPTQRDLEAMQSQGIIFSQMIPTGEKLSLKTNMNRLTKDITDLEKEQFKKRVISKLTTLYYKHGVIKKKLGLIKRYKKNVKELENYSLFLYKNSNLSQTEAYKADILNSNLEIKESNLLFNLEKIKLEIEKIAYSSFKNIDSQLNLDLQEIFTDLKNHPEVRQLELDIEKTKIKAELAEAKKFGDVKLTVGYYDRETKEDYLSFNVMMPFGMYGTEESEKSQSLYLANAKEESLKNLVKSFQTEVEILKASMETNLRNYKTLKQKIIPAKEHIEKILESQNSTRKGSSKMVLESINSTISLELLALDELSNYYESYGKLKYFEKEN